MDEEKMMDLMKRMYVDTYTAGWEGAFTHYKKELIKNILSDGVISTNVDVNHLERIIRIIEDTK